MAATKTPMRVLFDLDNCLYSYEKSGCHIQMAANITNYYASHLNIPDDEARTLANKYYHEYGLAITGLLRHHADKVDEVDYIAKVHHCSPMAELFPEDKPLQQMLSQMREDGHDLWIFTNGDVNHATRVLKCLGCYDFFLHNKAEDGTEVFKCCDYRAQWNICEAEGMAPYQNKPHMGPYQHFDKYAAQLLGEEYAKRTKTAIEGGMKTLFIEDSKQNLASPKELGWGTVLVTHSKSAGHSTSLIAMTNGGEKSADVADNKQDAAKNGDDVNPSAGNSPTTQYPSFIDVTIPTVHSLLDVINSGKW